ncbi:MAG: hypothetical protein JSR36_16620 [Proteobacteria bacterium]|nr:hypothetical protein [Pseudomonadota bacterium]
MKRTSNSPVPHIGCRLVPTAVASGLLAPVALAAPGDLDPTFGDMGRTTWEQYFSGPAWSVQPLPADESLVAGGHYCDYYCSYYGLYDTGFFGELSDSGALAQNFTDSVTNREIHELALQSDGKVVAVGREYVGSVNEFTVMRMDPDGTLDSGFADHGVWHQPADSYGQAVTVDPAGTITAAGTQGDSLLVVRLLSDGTPDPAFGSAGVFTGPANSYIGTHIVRTMGGAYRINVNSGTTGACSVVGLSPAGQLDNSFGSSGIASVGAPAASPASCAAMAAQADGSLLLAGTQGGHGFAARLLASGAADASFVPGEVPTRLHTATALAVDANGKVLIAGTPTGGLAGALVLRLTATGTLDPVFGGAGTAWIDVGKTPTPAINDLKVLADGRVLAAGDAMSAPLVVRLLGDSGSPGAGVIGVGASFVQVKEKDHQAVVTVRRTGGAVGAVSVSYSSGDYTAGDAPTATAGQDYTAVTGQLSWADGDRSDRQITVPITDDSSGPVEMSERFAVTLSSATGGAALGTGSSTLEILGDGDPAGQFDFQETSATVSEGAVLTVVVNRNYYSAGAVSVTLTPTPGSAGTADFASAPVTLSWADGETGPKQATFAITQDNTVESSESFTIVLSNPTNGAVIGPQSVYTVTIQDLTVGPPHSSGSGGGGSLDWLVLGSLGLARWLRRRGS